MEAAVEPSIHMWFCLALTVLAIVSFTMEKLPIEGTCVALLTSLLVFGQFFPYQEGDQARNLLDAKALLSGFANPSLIAVLCLLIMGQGITQTDALRPLTRYVLTPDARFAWLSIIAILLFVGVVSAFMNNTPLVIIAIPLIQLLAQRMGLAESRLLIPLSYVAILGGMTTLVGSSTNLLVASTMREVGYAPLEFFDFLVPGAMLAGVGLVYIIGILPRLLPDRSSLATQLVGGQKKFIAELDVGEDSKLIGMECVDGVFPELPELDIRLIQRSGHLILPPFEGYQVQKGDILIVAATRDALASMLSKYPGFLLSEDQERMVERQREKIAKSEDDSGDRDDLDRQVEDTRVLAEVMVPPGSRLIDMAIEHVGFDRQYGVIILGVQRRARVVRRRLGRIRLEPGDVLLLVGNRRAIDSLRNNQDLIVLSGSKADLPVASKAPMAGGIFVGTITSAATGVLSIPVAAILGSVLMLVTGCLNIRQATRAVDRKIFLLVGSMLALGTALEVTGGALYVAEQLLKLPYTDVPIVLAAVLFLLVAVATNILTNNACAILFTPIALNLAANAGVDPHIFAITVVLGANCSFASPIGYQTNLLVMGPGHYRFRDFMKAGVPLILIMWIAYIFVARYYFGL